MMLFTASSLFTLEFLLYSTSWESSGNSFELMGVSRHQLTMYTDVYQSEHQNSLATFFVKSQFPKGQELNSSEISF